MADDPHKREAAQWLQRGIAALKARDVKRAREYLLKARALDKSNVDVLLWLTRTTRDPEWRKRILEQVLALEPGHVQARRALERIAAQLAGQPAETPPEESAEEALSAPPPTMPEFEMAAEEEAPPGESLYLPETGELVGPEPVPAEQAPAEQVLAEAEAPESLYLAEMGELPSAEEVLADQIPAEPTRMAEAPAARVAAPAPPEEEELVAPVYEAPPGTPLMPPPPDVEGPPPLEITHLYPDTAWPEAGQARRCLTCGAISLVPRGTSARTPCPLCMQNILEAALGLDVLLPDAYLPFKVQEAEAAIAIEDAESSGGGLRLFRGRRQMSRPRAVYLPLWLFNGVGRVAYALGTGGQAGSREEPYERVPVHGVPQLDGKLLRLASNVDLAGAPRYESRVGAKAFVLLPNVTLQRAVVDVRGLINNDARQKARRALVASGGDASGLTITESEAAALAYQLMLLPVWINDVREGGTTYMGFVNAYSGQAMIGEPVQRLRRR